MQLLPSKWKDKTTAQLAALASTLGPAQSGHCFRNTDTGIFVTWDGSAFEDNPYVKNGALLIAAPAPNPIFSATYTAMQNAITAAKAAGTACPYAEGSQYQITDNALGTLDYVYEISSGYLVQVTAPSYSAGSQRLLTDVTTNTYGATISPNRGAGVYYATIGLSDAGADAAATITIYGSNKTRASSVAADLVTIATLTLAGTGASDVTISADSDYAVVDNDKFPYVWAVVSGIVGTDATVNCWRLS